MARRECKATWRKEGGFQPPAASPATPECRRAVRPLPHGAGLSPEARKLGAVDRETRVRLFQYVFVFAATAFAFAMALVFMIRMKELPRRSNAIEAARAEGGE